MVDTKEPRVPDAGDLNQVLDELRQAGREPDRALLDRVKAPGQAAVPPLIQMAVDENLHQADSDSAEVWAPIHAIRILGEFEAPEAIEPLLSLFDQVDDDSLAELLPEALGSIGAPALAPLRALLFDRARGVWPQIRAVESLSEMGQRHPETRSEVISALGARLDPAESQEPEDERLNAFVIAELLTLKAVEAAPAIRRAFEEDRVDTSIVDLDHSLAELGLPHPARPPRPEAQEGLRLRLLCTACRYEREHSSKTIYLDLATQERRKKGEETPYSEFVIPQRITCPKCGAVDQYELGGLAHFALTAELLKRVMRREAGLPDAEDDKEGPLRLIRFGLADGREMHPYEARDLYRRQVEAEPDRADLRVRYANVLRWLDDKEEATEHYRAATRLEPANLEASYNLGTLAQEAGDRTEARRMFESVLAEAPNSRLPRKTRDDYVAAAAEELDELDTPAWRPGSTPILPWPRDQAQSPTRRTPRAMASPRPVRATKIGRNDPCPCGSGQKYKRCHGR